VIIVLVTSLKKCCETDEETLDGSWMFSSYSLLRRRTN